MPSCRAPRAPAEPVPGGYAPAMTQPERTQPERPLSLADVAAEDPEESVARERDAVGDQPDTGGLVPPDSSQTSPDAQP